MSKKIFSSYRNLKFRLVILYVSIIGLYFLNNIFKEYSDSSFLKYYFNDVIAGAMFYYLIVNYIILIYPSAKNGNVIALAIVFFCGYIWEYHSHILFVDTTADPLDIVAYLAYPIYNILKSKRTH